MSFLDRIAECRRFNPAGYRPFRVDGQAVGLIEHGFADHLRRFPAVFAVNDDAVNLAPGLEGCERRTAEVDAALRRLADDGIIRGWRGEHYAVAHTFNAPPLFTIERAAVPRLGIRAAGVHVNGWLDGAGGREMWIGRRSLDRFASPGKLDQMVAGGCAWGYSVDETVVKECGEEADIDPALAARARPVGALTYTTEREEGLRRDIVFVYDLEVPPDFQPRNTDGEIDGFFRWPIEQVADVVQDSDAFKFNCALVAIDFLVRHGHIGPDFPDYLAIVEGLHG